MNHQTNSRFREIWKFERVICRLTAAWCFYAVFVMWYVKGDFWDLSFAQELSFSLMGLMTAGNFLVLTWLAILLHPLHSDSLSMLLAATLLVGKWLSEVPKDRNADFFFLAAATAYALFLVYTVYANRELCKRWRPGKISVTLLALTAAFLSFSVISGITCLRYLTFSSPNYDFGIFVNMFHNMKETGLPLVTCERDRLLSHFAVHLSPVYYLLLPFYCLFPSPLTLQIGQAAVLMLGIIPLLLLARQLKLSEKTTLVLALLYSFYPALTTGCFYDLHENAFLPLFLLLTFFFFESKHPIPMYLSALCVLSVKEDAAFYLIVFALYLVLSKRSFSHGIALGVLSLGWFFTAGYLLKTYGEGMMVNRFDNLIFNEADGLFGAVRTILTNPGYALSQLFSDGKGGFGKVLYFLCLMLPLGFLPFCSKKASRWLLLLPTVTNLITQYPYQYDMGFQYHFGISAFLFYAAALNLSDGEQTEPADGPLKRSARQEGGWKQTALSVGAAFCLCLYVFTAVPKLGTYAERYAENKDLYRHTEEILDRIPEDASVTCSTMLLPHLADREVIYEVGYHKTPGDTEYLVLDLRYRGWQDSAAEYLGAGYRQIYYEMGNLAVYQLPDFQSKP